MYRKRTNVLRAYCITNRPSAKHSERDDKNVFTKLHRSNSKGISDPCTGPEVSRRLRPPNFMTIGT
jgi:hypothetical protein